MRARVPGVAITAVLAAVGTVLAHELMFLLTYGDRAAVMLAGSGHGQQWADAVLAVLALGGTLAVAAARQLWRLGRSIRDLERRGLAASARRGAPDSRSVATLWASLAAAVVLLLVLQENIEHLAAGRAAPGLGVLASQEYPLTLPIIAVVTLAIAVVAALFRVRVAILRARIAAARRPVRRGGSRPLRRRAAWPVRPAGSILGRRQAGRAPPVAAG